MSERLILNPRGIDTLILDTDVDEDSALILNPGKDVDSGIDLFIPDKSGNFLFLADTFGNDLNMPDEDADEPTPILDEL